MRRNMQPEPDTLRMTLRSPRQVLPTHGGLLHQRGAVMPMVVVALVALIGIAGLVTDYAPVYLDKNQLQHAADAAALAAEEYLKNNSSATDSQVIQKAKDVFDRLKPEGASGLQAQHVKIDRSSGALEPKVDIIVSSSRDTALTRVLKGAPDSVSVTATAVAQQKLDDAVQACLSPMVICSDATYNVGQKYAFTVGTDLLFLCEDGDPNDPNSRPNCDALDTRMAKGTYPFGGGVYNVGASGAYCYKIPGKTVKGHKTGQYRGGLNSRFFDCGVKQGDNPKPGMPSGYANCLPGYKRDKISWTGFKIDSSSANIGNLTYAQYASAQTQNQSVVPRTPSSSYTGNVDLWGCNADWDSSQRSSCVAPNNKTKAGDIVNVSQNTDINRRTFIVAQVPKSACSAGTVEFDSSKVKVSCFFLRQPVGTNDNQVYGEITNADCGGLATSGVGGSRKFNTRLFD